MILKWLVTKLKLLVKQKSIYFGLLEHPQEYIKIKDTLEDGWPNKPKFIGFCFSTSFNHLEYIKCYYYNKQINNFIGPALVGFTLFFFFFLWVLSVVKHC
jgi:hypothetical protein